MRDWLRRRLATPSARERLLLKANLAYLKRAGGHISPANGCATAVRSAAYPRVPQLVGIRAGLSGR